MVRAPAPMVRREWQAGVVVATAAKPEQPEGQPAEELSTAGRVTEARAPGSELGERAALGAEVGGQDGVIAKESGRAALPYSLWQAKQRREMLVGRLSAVRWGGAEAGAWGATERDGVRVAESAVMTDEGAAPTARGPGGEAAVRVAPRPDLARATAAEAEAWGAADRGELSVRELGREAEGAAARRGAQRRLRRGEFEAEEDLRLELVR